MALLNRPALALAVLLAAASVAFAPPAFGEEAPAPAGTKPEAPAPGPEAAPEAAAGPATDAATGTAGASEPAPGTGRLVFIAAEPLGGTVYIDGVRQDHFSPLLLRDFPEGAFTVRVEKEGYHPAEARIPAQGDAVLVLALVPERVELGLPDSGGEGSSLLLPSGTYHLWTGPAGLEVAAVYPRQRVLDGVRFALPAVGAVGAALAAREILAPREGDYLVSAELVAALGIGAGLLALDFVLESDRRDFLDAFRAETAPGSPDGTDALAVLQVADRALGRGDFGEALGRYEAFVEAFPDTRLSIQARLEIAGIRYLLGDLALAAELYRELTDEYPWPGLYDRAVKGRSDCALALGDPAGALELLELMSFSGGGLEREDIEIHRAWLEELSGYF
ncbi:MAG TPA: tetratricopeptide repeat protein [Spirochaetales bacterium]|nr:tetratricopeptide repeat protein [Spirochaetales bacterium]